MLRRRPPSAGRSRTSGRGHRTSGGPDGVGHRPGGSLQCLQRDVPGEPVRDDHIGLAGEEIAALDVPDEPDPGRIGEGLVRLDHVDPPLLLLLPDGEQRDPRLSTPRTARQNAGAEERELDQVLRADDRCGPHPGRRAARSRGGTGI
jgi:hypothetical protein